MATFIAFVSLLIYGATIDHRQWVISNPSPNGLDWFDHHVDTMLAEYQNNYISPNNLPPVLPWSGDHASPFGVDPTVPAALVTFAGIADENALGLALKNYYFTVCGVADEIAGLEKAPFSYRYWGYMKYAWTVRERFRLNTVIPEQIVYDIDGTILSAIPFINTFNDLHQIWHTGSVCSPNLATPTFRSTAGQMCGRQPTLQGQDFLDFHRDHLTLWNRWYGRTGQSPVSPINMRFGWPQSADAPNDPSTWSDPSLLSISPWINKQGQDADSELRAKTSADQIGNDIEGGYHGSGHINNDDIAPLVTNNFSPRFFAWHAFIEHQRYWREPRFATWDTATNYRNRVFNLVQTSGTALPDDFYTLTIVRDTNLAADYAAPLNVINNLDFVTGKGDLRFKFTSRDEYARPLKATITAEVFSDVGITATLIESIVQTINIGGGSPIALETPFDVIFNFNTAFKSDDPSRGVAAVGFVNSRIKVTGVLEVADGSDPDFVHTDYIEIYLVKEKLPPTIEPFLDISTFSDDQVASQLILTPTQARFTNALIVVLQDRTVASRTFVWPSGTKDEVKGLITGYIPVSGLFNDIPNAPAVKIWRPTTDTEYTNFRVELSSGPLLESPAANPSLPQRFTYFYDVIFEPGNDAFVGVTPTNIVYPRIMIPAYDRSGNRVVKFSQISLTSEASPYMRDGATSWLSIDTRVFKINQVTGASKFGSPFGPAISPTTFITTAINNMNGGLTAEQFDDLPTNQGDSVLEFSPTVGGTPVFNFAMAKVRLQGVTGATNVRAFFRLFTYSATNLIFDQYNSYRSVSSGLTRVPVVGYASSANGAATHSIPFFASPRVGFTGNFASQTDPLNVKNFPTGFVDEQVIYFGVYLDINQNTANSKVPPSLVAAHIDGPFSSGEVQNIRTIIHDAHQCMVVELKFDGNPTVAGDTPSSSSNLAQRNLLILETDNPGSLPTHTVQHSFHVDLRKAPSTRGQNQPWVAPLLVDRFQRDKLQAGLAVKLKWAGDKKTDPAVAIQKQYPLTFDKTSTAVTTQYFDELMIRWPNRPYLPPNTTAEIYIPSIALARSVNLRNVRHAPNTVRIVDTHTLSLTVPDCKAISSEKPRYCAVSYVPLPYQLGDNLELAGIVTIYLPDGIKEGTKWTVDVIQIRGGEAQQVLGGFQVYINTTKAKYGKMLDQDTRLLSLLHQRLSLRSPSDIWYKVLQKRVVDTRARCVALAQTTDTQFTDPTRTKRGNPITGRLIRVVLDQLWYGGRPGNQFRFRSLVYTSDNDGASLTTFIPTAGGLSVTGCNTTTLQTQLPKILFEGWVDTILYFEIRGNRTISNIPTQPQAACACDSFCFPGQQCLSGMCTTVPTVELPIYSKTLTGNVANFVDSYSSTTDVPNVLKDSYVVFWHIEYL